jgi:bifunctional DNA-binding transcriptional regulator/antitoxin component of YhaV-PrlF toxin-antitoxin module
MGAKLLRGNAFYFAHRTVDVPEITLDDRGRLTVPKPLRERYGDRYRLVEVHDGLKLVPVADDPLAALREAFDGVDPSATDLRERGREAGIDAAGQ